ncbi:hypothetical protein [Streptomyces sp. 135]|uniref:hypothetical protein n=1 Tax=Streptomyces sp. 135 TaxID=2838850 RepID=UPI001CBBEC48|nr:hypothetical protein [Streptomyces sp. 135]
MGSITAPEITGGTTASAAEACATEVATYLINPDGNKLQKYVDWNPSNASESALIDSGKSASLDSDSYYFTGGHGVLYEITAAGVLKSYQDRSASGGSLLTPVKTYTSNWTARHNRVWSNGELIFSIHGGGKLEIWHQSAPLTGAGEVTLDPGVLPVDNPAVVAFTKADDVWAVGSTTYTLTDGVIRAWPYTDSPRPSFPAQGTVVGTTDATQKQGWSAGPGTVRTATSDGTVRAYEATSNLAVTNTEYGLGFSGEALVDTAACLADAGEAKPTMGAEPDDPDAPAAVSEEPGEPAAPGAPEVLKGKFVLGSGAPAAGLTVNVEAIDAVPEDGTEVELPLLGTTVTAADGSWSLPLPKTLPADVQQAAAENGGIVNAMATVTGKTSTGVPMGGITHLAAAPATATASALSLAVADDESTTPAEVLPLGTTPDSSEVSSLSQAEDSTTSAEMSAGYAASWASKQEASAIDTLGDSPLPKWQNATGDLPTGFNPYMVNGQDTKNLAVGPMDGGCDRTKTKVINKKIYYTTVGEGHAYWDAKASVDYDSKLSSTVEVAAKTGSNWTITGSATLGSSMSVTTGYTNKGPHYAKQWKVPIKYTKYKETWKCGGNNTFTRYVIVPGKYKIPSGGAAGKFGKDVRHKDGSAYYNSKKSHRAYVARGSYFQLSKNRSIKWSGAVSAYGVSLGGSTAYDREHRQRITAGDKKSYKHYIWGKNGSLSGKPGVFYSY